MTLRGFDVKENISKDISQQPNQAGFDEVYVNFEEELLASQRSSLTNKKLHVMAKLHTSEGNKDA